MAEMIGPLMKESGADKMVGDAANKVFQLASNQADYVIAYIQHIKSLEIGFPKEAVGPFPPTEMNLKAYDEYRLPWEPADTYTFRSGYYSHIRVATKKVKRHKLKTMKKIASKVGTDKYPKKKDFERRVREKALAAVASKHADELRVVLADPSKKYSKYVKDYRRRYKISSDVDDNADNLGKAAAEYIFTSSKHKKELEDAVRAEWERRARKVLELRAVGPGQTAGKMLAEQTATDVKTSKRTSVEVGYEVQYETFKVNMEAMDLRWDAIRREGKAKIRNGTLKLREAQSEHQNKLQALRLRLITEERKIEEKVTDAGRKSELTKQLEELRNQRAAADKSQQDSINDLNDELGKLKQKLADLNNAIIAEKNKLHRLFDDFYMIGTLSITPLQDKGPVPSKIHYRNTDAKFEVTNIKGQPSGDVVVEFLFQETALDLPLVGKVTRKKGPPKKGGVIFKADGTFEADGVVGARFQELCPDPEIS